MSHGLRVACSGTLCVDTFLFISAFLATFLLLKKLEKEKRPVSGWLPMYYVNRFARITPAYMFALFLNWKVAPLLATGPVARQVWENSNLNCKDQWWHHLLYINTVVPWMFKGALCFGHTWYLANDMMYFITVPALVLLYRHKGNVGKALASLAAFSVVLGSIIFCWVESKKRHWSPNTWDGPESTYFHDEAFSLPYTRCPSYYIGVLTAFLWYEKKRVAPAWKAPTWMVAVVTLLASTLMVAIMYGPTTGSMGVQACIIHRENCGSPWPRMVKVVMSSLARPGWALGIATMCLMCFNGQGGLVNQLLSASIWAPFSFLSYTVYLVHFTVLTFYMSTLTSRLRWDFFDFVVLYLGLTMISHLLALFVAILVEKPAMKLQKYYLEPAPAKKAAPAAPKATAAVTGAESKEVELTRPK
jgi:peptidoglycan/LPS O-acetylase OafA/YrhL